MSLLKSILNLIVKTVTESNSERDLEQPARPSATPRRPEPSLREPMRQQVSDWPRYFAEILSSEFPQYSVKRNVPVTDLAGYAADVFQLYATRPQQTYKAERGAPYTFVLYQGDQPAAVVMLGDGASHSRSVKYLIARMYAKKLGLPYINFYTQCPNERGYVVSRIRQFLNA